MAPWYPLVVMSVVREVMLMFVFEVNYLAYMFYSSRSSRALGSSCSVIS